jgi:hypothetical protein
MTVQRTVDAKGAAALYGFWTELQGIHCNRFPAWHELTYVEKQDWLAKNRITVVEPENDGTEITVARRPRMEVGSCNACTSRRDEDMVTQVTLRGMSFRLCSVCGPKLKGWL